jgi:dihydrodipicolinate synthase/N-acetylneuraminate lyase
VNDGRVAWAGSFVALLTPFARSGELDEDLLRSNIEMTLREGAHGVLIGGHNGEAHLCADSERRRTWEIAVEVIASRVPVLAGTGGIRTEHVIELTREARSLGVDGAMIEIPYFMTPNAPDVLEHFRAVSDAVDLPIMVYNHPKRTGVSMTTAMLRDLADVPNIVAVKDSSGDFVFVLECLRAIGDRVRFFIGPARLYGVPAVVMGAAGFVDGLPQVMGAQISQMYEAASRGNLEVARRIQWDAFELGELLYRARGTWPATGKDAMRLQGRPGGWPRRPLRPMEGADLATLARGLERLGLLNVAAAPA